VATVVVPDVAVSDVVVSDEPAAGRPEARAPEERDFPAIGRNSLVGAATSGDSVPHGGRADARRDRHETYAHPVRVPTKPAPGKPAPAPLQVDTLRVVLAGTALWAVALVVLLLLGDRVDRVWTWTCVAAIGLAAIGIGVMKLQGQLRSERDPDGPRGAERASGSTQPE
jgi:hypothetical protein